MNVKRSASSAATLPSHQRRALPAVTRRQVLLTTGGLAAGLAIARHAFALGSAGTPFTLGVASGDPSPDGFVLWTRLAPDPLAFDGSGG